MNDALHTADDEALQKVTARAQRPTLPRRDNIMPRGTATRALRRTEAQAASDSDGLMLTVTDMVRPIRQLTDAALRASEESPPQYFQTCQLLEDAARYAVALALPRIAEARENAPIGGALEYAHEARAALTAVCALAQLAVDADANTGELDDYGVPEDIKLPGVGDIAEAAAVLLRSMDERLGAHWDVGSFVTRYEESHRGNEHDVTKTERQADPQKDKT